MAESARSKSAEKLSRIIVRLFIIVLAFLLLQAGWDHYAPLVFGNNKPLPEGGCAGLVYWRDRRIDRLRPTVTPAEDSAFTAEEINAAVDALKESFKLQKVEYGLCAVRFDETASRRILARLPQPENGERYLALLCDYNVYDDTEAGDKQGYYPNAVFLLQEGTDAAWRVAHTAAAKALVCPLQQHDWWQ